MGLLIHTQDADFTLYQGDVLDQLAELADESVHCVVTSPPYWGLRDYGTGEWEGGDPDCDHKIRETRSPHERRSSTLDGGTDTIRVQEEASTTFRDVCGKCGARRVDQQLGLEPTPDAYVQRMVEVFREVRRVLRSDGTCWVNLGDSYASAWACDRRNVVGNGSLENGKRDARPNRLVGGLKEKDLVGIPWAVAKALQEPYYAGNIPRERDRVWLAAMIDGEGSICGFLHERKDDGRIRTGVHVTITNTSRALLDEAQRIWPTSREDHNPHGEGHHGSLPIWRWIAHGAESKAALMREVYPYLIVKRTQALLAYNLLRFQMDGKRLGRSEVGDEIRAKRELLTRLLSDANGQRPVDVPSWCVEPPSLYEPGWYLRSDIIWSKPNPMPESVTDRPTKAHEYLFLLAKSARYFFDQEAVREPHSEKTWFYRDVMPTKAFGNLGNHNGDPNSGSTLGTEAAQNPAGRNVRSVWEMEQVGRPRGARHTLTDDYFASIQTEEQAYWLGFIYADGYVDRRSLDVMLSEKDAAHLDRLREALGSSRPVTISDDGRARFVASSLRMAEDLRVLGADTRDSFPPLDPLLTRHFIRGVFDGDGSIWSYLPSGRTRLRYGAQILGSEGVLSAIREHLSLPGKPKFSRGIHRLSIAAIGDIANLHQYLYGAATVWLERKRIKFPQAQVVSPDVWPIATQPYPEAHFATYPEELVRRCILAGTSEYGCCPECGKPWEREVEKETTPTQRVHNGVYDPSSGFGKSGWLPGQQTVTTLGWRPGCDCEGDYGVSFVTGETVHVKPFLPIPCTVLDPFLGSGTTAHVARQHGRRSIGIELNESYCDLAAKRMAQQSLFAEAT